MIVAWIAALFLGLGLTAFGSGRAVHHAAVVARSSRLSSFFVGAILLSIGTDLPEIANSIVASVSGHGDLNLGDSTGSAATQLTLVLGLLFVSFRQTPVQRRGVIQTGLFSVAALALGIALFSDGYLGRIDAAILASVWYPLILM